MTTLETFKFIIDSSTAKARTLETTEEVQEFWGNIWGILSVFTLHEGEYYGSQFKDLQAIVEIARLKAQVYSCQ